MAQKHPAAQNEVTGIGPPRQTQQDALEQPVAGRVQGDRLGPHAENVAGARAAGQELNGGIDVLDRELLTTGIEFVIVVHRRDALIEIAVLAHDPNVHGGLRAERSGRSDRSTLACVGAVRHRPNWRTGSGWANAARCSRSLG